MPRKLRGEGAGDKRSHITWTIFPFYRDLIAGRSRLNWKGSPAGLTQVGFLPQGLRGSPESLIAMSESAAWFSGFPMKVLS